MSEDFFTEEASSSDKPQDLFLKHLAKEKKWFIGEDVIDVEYLMLDPETIKTGIGRYAGGYEFEWAKERGSKIAKLDDTWKDAFSVWVFVHGHDKPVLWERMSWGEVTAFRDMCPSFWHGANKEAPALPVFKYSGSKTIKFESGFSSAIPEFEFQGYKPRPEGFVIPEWANEKDMPVAAEIEQEAKAELKQDDIPF